MSLGTKGVNCFINLQRAYILHVDTIRSPTIEWQRGGNENHVIRSSITALPHVCLECEWRHLALHGCELPPETMKLRPSHSHGTYPPTHLALEASHQSVTC